MDNLRNNAVAARRAKIAEGDRYRRDWLDADHWIQLAKARGLRLPQWHVAPTPASLGKWHKQLQRQAGSPAKQLGCMADVFGYSNNKPIKWAKLIERNPTMPLRAFIGVMLEQA